jgi:hypothetical protein
MCIYIYVCVIYVYTYIFGAHGCIIEGSLEVNFPTIWTDGKQRWEEKKKEDQKEKVSEERRSRRAKR